MDVDTSWQCLEYYAGLAGSMAGKPSPGLCDLLTRRQGAEPGVNGIETGLG